MTFVTNLHTKRKLLKESFNICDGRGPLPLHGEMIVALGLGGDVLPQLAGRQAGPRRVVTTAGDPVATLATFAA